MEKLNSALRCSLTWVLMAMSVALGGCATISEEDCPRVDWFALGVEDGRHGYPEARIVQHREACMGAGVQPDHQRYWAGRLQGLARYCTLASALEEGRAGRTYKGVCPPQIDPAFRDVYRAGYAVHESLEQVRATESTINGRERELRKDGLSDRDRERLRSEIRDLDRRRESLRDELYRRERELEHVRRRYRV